MANVAFPEVIVRDPRTALPSLNSTVPLIVPGVADVTVAVNVTLWPTRDECNDVLNDVELAASTFWMNGAETDGFTNASPP